MHGPKSKDRVHMVRNGFHAVAMASKVDAGVTHSVYTRYSSRMQFVTEWVSSVLTRMKLGSLQSHVFTMSIIPIAIFGASAKLLRQEN